MSLPMSDVAPRPSMKDIGDGGSRDAELLSESILGQSAAASNHSDVGLGQLGVVVGFADRPPYPSDAVSHVLPRCSSPEMCRLNADRSIARMQDVWLVARNWVIRIKDGVRNHVGAEMDPVYGELSVTMFILRGWPVPTSLRRRGSRRRIAGQIPSEHLRLRKAGWPAQNRAATKRVARSVPALVVRIAQSLRLVLYRVSAIEYRARHLFIVQVVPS